MKYSSKLFQSGNLKSIKHKEVMFMIVIIQ
jgi:hypothetical protein